MIAVFAEIHHGRISKVGFELISRARELASRKGSEVVAILICSERGNFPKDLVDAGADRVIVAQDPIFEIYDTGAYAAAVSRMAEALKPEMLLFGATPVGRDLAPRVANSLNTGLTADCTALDIDEETGLLLQTRPAFGGNIMATIICPERRPQMATVRPGAIKIGSGERSSSPAGKIEFFDARVSNADLISRVLEISRKARPDVDLESAKIVVSGGRGLKGPENFGMLRELAVLLGAELGASRAAVDSTWISHDHQVGQTGHITHPDLYIACGISGAIQHLAGMGNAKYIIAINKDRNAPIHDVADLSIIGDLFKVVPKLIEMIKGR